MGRARACSRVAGGGHRGILHERTWGMKAPNTPPVGATSAPIPYPGSLVSPPVPSHARERGRSCPPTLHGHAMDSGATWSYPYGRMEGLRWLGGSYAQGW